MLCIGVSFIINIVIRVTFKPKKMPKRKADAQPDLEAKRPKIKAEPDLEAMSIILTTTTQEGAALMGLQKIDRQLLENKKLLNRLDPLSASWLLFQQEKLKQMHIIHDEWRRRLSDQYDKISKLSGEQLDVFQERSQIILERLQMLYTRMSTVPRSTTAPNAHLGMPPLEKP